MEKKHIQVIGGGLYGCLTAYYLAKKHPNYQIQIIEYGNHLLPAFDSIQLGQYKCNNGFHGIELPRASGLFDFLSKELEIDIAKSKNFRGLFIKNYLVPFEAKTQKWPEELQASFRVSAPYYFNHQTDLNEIIAEPLMSVLKKISTRYSNDMNDVKGLLVPWFLPADFIIKTEDEGDIFRNSVRSGDITAFYAYPPSGLFEELQEKMRIKLQETGVEILFNTKVFFEPSGSIKYQKLNSDEPLVLPVAESIFFCASPALILKDINVSLFQTLIHNKRVLYNAIVEFEKDKNDSLFDYSEILCAIDTAVNISRLSFPKIKSDTDENKRYVQVELFASPEDNIDMMKETLIEHINKMFDLKETGLAKCIDFKKTRDVFFPPSDINKQGLGALYDWINTHFGNKFKWRPVFAPINMSKTWLWAQENAGKINS